jgi:rod shape-determining protein MreB
MFTQSFYVQVRENRFQVRNIANSLSLQRQASPGFSHPRMLVGDFSAAQASLKSLLAEARGSGLILSTAVVIHPLEKIEGGLSQIEERMLHELAVGAGASKVVVWVGDPLSDAEVAAKLQGK